MENRLLNKSNVFHIKNNELEYLQFSNLKKYEDILIHCFTTRKGGSSEGDYNSLNLGFYKNDEKENVLENFKRITGVLGIDYRNLVFSNQIHEKRVKAVDESDRGKGIVLNTDIIGFDGLMTNKREVALVTFYADCVPIFFFDPIEKVIAISHSGWRGTVKEIAKETLSKMNENYGCRANNIETVIGPSIGQCCFEVGEEVYKEFIENLDWSKEYCVKGKENKWYINLQSIIKKTLLDCGVNENKICITQVCTKCNKDLFFSYRGDNGKTGVQAAIMQIK